MKNKKIILFLSFCILLTSCGSDDLISNEHLWKFDGTMHWQEQDGQKINQATHRYGDWVIDNYPTCISDGLKTKECNVCHYKKTESIPKTGHSYGEWINDGNISYRTCSACGDKQTTVREQSISFKTPYEGATIDLCDPIIRDLINHKNDDNYVATHHMTYGNCHSGISYDYQTYVEITILDSKQRDAKYTLSVSLDSDFTNIIDTYVTSYKNIRLDGILLPNTTYFYKVDVDDGDYSSIDSFKTYNSPVRFITCGGVNNVRDIGGWEAEDGKHIKYGLIYRGAGLNDSVSSMDAKSKEVFTKLGMRAELDLRDGASTQNIWDPSLPHLCVNGGWYTYLYDDQDKINALRSSLTFLSNEDNYPTYFHCSYGMDRTGTLAYILLGLLGVNENDIYLDYELSDYSSVADGGDSHCERAVISEIGEGQYKFDYSASSYPDGTSLRTPVYKCIQHFKQNYSGDTLQECITNYLIRRVGLSENTIVKLKSNLLY